MLSGSFRSYPIESITIAPERQRKEFSGIEELAESIRKLGLIHPIVLSPEGILVAGERRLRAHQHLGYTHIQVQFTNELPQEELEAIELEENVKRKALNWKEEVTAVTRLHKLKLLKDPSWRQQDTADLLSVSQVKVAHDLIISEYLEKGDSLVVNADTYSTARNICSRKEQRASVAEAENVNSAIDEVFKTPFSVNPSVKSPSESKSRELPNIAPVQPEVPYLHADFRAWSREPWSGPRFNFIHCDFPYGINYDKHNSGATKSMGGYEDTPELYQECLRALARIMPTHLEPSCHLMFWLSARLEIVHATKVELEAMGWKINPVPLIWHRSDNAGILPDPQRGPRQVYEMCLFGSIGDRKIVQPVSNLYGHPKTKDVHPSEKPRAMLEHFFRMFVDESSVVLDPTMGSGNAILAAEEGGAKSVLGLETLEEIYSNALLHRKLVKGRGT